MPTCSNVSSRSKSAGGESTARTEPRARFFFLLLLTSRVNGSNQPDRPGRSTRSACASYAASAFSMSLASCSTRSRFTSPRTSSEPWFSIPLRSRSIVSCSSVMSGCADQEIGPLPSLASYELEFPSSNACRHRTEDPRGAFLFAYRGTDGSLRSTTQRHQPASAPRQASQPHQARAQGHSEDRHHGTASDVPAIGIEARCALHSRSTDE